MAVLVGVPTHHRHAVIPRRSILLGALLVAACAAHAADSSVRRYLPASASVDADYVVVAYDPAYDSYGQHLQAAMRANAAWLRDYTLQHANQRPMPWHPNFGVPKAQYDRFQSPVNHFIELSRQRIRIERREEGGRVRLRLHGQQLLLDTLTIDPAVPLVQTTRGALPFRERQSPGPATMPPGATEGLGFMSDEGTIAQKRFRESVLIGKLTGTTRGIIRYSLNTPGKAAYVYITFPLRN